MTPDPLARFNEKWTLNEDGCHVWQTGLFDSGYAAFWADGRTRRGHVWIWERTVGPVPDGLILDHRCRNHACVNVAHLEPVTQQVNTLRGVGPSAVNARKTHCSKSHELTPENTYTFPSKGNRRVCKTCWLERRAAARKAVA